MTTSRNSFLFSGLLLASLATGCPDAEPQDSDGSTSADDATGPTADETVGGCEVSPGDWDAPEWETTAAKALALRAQLDALTGDATMRGAETGAVVVDLAGLTAVWDGDPSLAAVANPGYVPVIDAAFDEFLTVVAAGPQELMDMDGQWAPGTDGGLWGDDARGINEGGLEVRQLVDKGGYSAGVLYAYALGLTEGELGPDVIDAIAAAWGANADLDPAGDLTDAAGYAHSMGFFATMAGALTDAKAYAADETCQAQRDDALVEFFDSWERSMVARTVFYGNRAETKLLAATDGTGFADVLHDLAEGVGVTAGFLGLPDPASGPLAGRGRTITDEQVNAVMAAFGVDLANLGASTTGGFVQSLPDLEAAVAEAEGVLMDVYGFDAATIAGFAMPTAG